MPAGRPPKPKELHILEGTFRADRHGGAGEGVQAAGAPACPKSLRGEARKLWGVVLGLGVAREADGPALTALCEWWARYRKYSTALDRLGPTNKNTPRLLGLVKLAWAEVERLAGQFGITPAARMRLRVEGPKKASGVMTRQRNA